MFKNFINLRIKTSINHLIYPKRFKMASRDIFAMLSQKKSVQSKIENKRTRNDDDDEKIVKKVQIEENKENNVDLKQKVKEDDSLAYDSETEKKDFEDAKELIKSTKVNSAKIDLNHQILYSEIVKVFDEIEQTSKRLEIIQLTSDFFLEVLKSNPTQLVPITYLFINRLGPDYEGLELGLGETILIKTISESTGKSTQQVKAKYKETGDLGLIALQARSVQPTMFKPKPLTAAVVFDNLKQIALSSGKDSQTKKINIIKRMLTSSNGLEAKFLIRSLESKLRIGLAEKTVLISLAKAILSFQESKITPELLVQVEEIIRDSFCQIPNYEILIKNSLKYGILNLKEHCVLKPGIPLKPMLAKPTKSITEILDKFNGEEFICEYKYDGERAQVHLLSTGEIKIFSRNSEDMSQRYPDVIENIHGFIKDKDSTKSLILDCEAVAFDRESNKILPFQVLTTRKRKDVQMEDIKIQVCLFAFDILCLNDKPLINESLKTRKDILFDTLLPIPGKFQFATSKTTSDTDELQKFLDESINSQCEGLMVKTLNNDPYRPSQRSNSWLKLKKDYLEGVGDSLDLVVIGAYYGKGKRTGTYGGFLLACYNQDSGEYETCCKIGTGFSDEMLKQLYESLSKTEIQEPKSYYLYDSSAKPDVWLEPSTLFEVLTADLSLSPIYKAGVNVFGKGVSLRFPRFLRIREDKSVEDATSSEQVVEFYERQASNN